MNDVPADGKVKDSEKELYGIYCDILEVRGEIEEVDFSMMGLSNDSNYWLSLMGSKYYKISFVSQIYYRASTYTKLMSYYKKMRKTHKARTIKSCVFQDYKLY